MASVRREKTADTQQQRSRLPTLCQAVLGCFLRCQHNEGPVCAVVCRHVTKTAEGSFFLGDPHPDTEIARKKNFSRCHTETLKNDVDLIVFTDSKQNFVQSIYRNPLGEKRKFRLYEGSIEGLHRAEVFQCYRTNGNKTISKKGVILATPDLPTTLIDLICPESNFIVDDINGESFADEGDSGRVVAREVDDGCIELVGIITWGQFQCRDDPKNSGNYSICLLLRCAIKYLNQQYQLNMCLYDIPDEMHDDGDVIEPGQVVSFTAGQ